MKNLKRIGFNVNGHGLESSANRNMWNRLLNWGKQHKPTTMLIMDDANRMNQWYEQVGGKALIFRTYNPFGDSVGSFDNQFHQLHTPKEASNRLEHMVNGIWSSYPSLRYEVFHEFGINEPGGNWHDLQEWIIEFAKLNKEKGLKTTSGGLAIGKNWHTPQLIESGFCDDLIKYANENRDTFLLTTHEYTVGALWGVNTGEYPHVLFDPSKLYMRKNDVTLEWDEYSGEYGVNWHLGRTAWVSNVRAKQLGFEPLPFVLTEGVWDHVWDIYRDTPDETRSMTVQNGVTYMTLDHLKEVYGIPKYNNDVRGILAQRNLFAGMRGYHRESFDKYKDDEFADDIIMSFEWLEENYPDNCIGFNLFSVNENWRIPEGHDFSDPQLDPLFDKMVVHTWVDDSEGDSIPPMPSKYVFPNREDDGWIKAFAQSVGSKTNVRIQPTTNSAIVGSISGEGSNVLVNIFPVEIENYDWYPVRTNDFNGWVRGDVFRFEESLQDIFDDVEKSLVKVSLELEVEVVNGKVSSVEVVNLYSEDE